MLTTVSDWRPMRQSDLGAVDEIAKIVHPAYPEDIAVATERLALFPQGCFIAEGEAGPLGYAISHPMILGRPAPLDSLLGGLPTKADCLFLHDIALTARARGLGLGRLLIARLREVATRQGLARLALVSVNNSQAYWQAQGFEALAPDAALATKLASYGDDAAYMARVL